MLYLVIQNGSKWARLKEAQEGAMTAVLYQNKPITAKHSLESDPSFYTAINYLEFGFGGYRL